jgi:hypothetical protein
MEMAALIERARTYLFLQLPPMEERIEDDYQAM